MKADSAGIVERLNAIDPYLKHMPHERAVVAEAAAHIEAQAVELERVKAENDRLGKAVIDGVLPGLLTEEERDALVGFMRETLAALKGAEP